MHRAYLCLAVLFVGIAAARILKVDATTPQGFDEPCHVGAGMEWVDKHTYKVDPVHPPLARYAITLPLYLAGERFPYSSPKDFEAHPYINDPGDAILYHKGQYKRNLFLARIGILPFFCLATIATFLWTERYFGPFAACIAVLLVSTTPSVLGFSSLAYNDLPVAALQLTFLCLLTLWLEKPHMTMTVLLGIVAGLAIGTKFTSLVFLTASTLAVLFCRWAVIRYRHGSTPYQVTIFVKYLLATAAVAVFVLWGIYGFSMGHVQERMGLSAQAMPSFQHFPAPVRDVARKAILSNPIVPAPELIHGLAKIWVANQVGPETYLFGRKRNGGWWYFFPIALALKTPLPLFILAVIGFVYVLRSGFRDGQWHGLVAAIPVPSIIAVAMLGKYNVGTRYVLVVFLLLAILAGIGAAGLWRRQKLSWGRAVVCGMLLWQGVITISARDDFLAYFNELAPAEPSQALVSGCDLDCGQDVFRLAQELHARAVSYVNIAVWSSADLTQMKLPEFSVLEPFHPVRGWIAVSARSRLMEFPVDALKWLDAYRPVTHVGRTILLYHIPDRN
ncbi:MAG TPA: hypothetical protein VMT53_15875 [Terriglobales bacterium]|nr:hypothetical protein [Terriglobales bacterium]